MSSEEQPLKINTEIGFQSRLKAAPTNRVNPVGTASSRDKLFTQQNLKPRNILEVL